MDFLKISKYVHPTVPSKYKEAFTVEINKIDLYRVKAFSVLFIIIECMMLLFTFVMEKEQSFQSPHIYYIIMYLILLAASCMSFVASFKLPKYKKMSDKIYLKLFYSLSVLMLSWNAIISLMDQSTYGQINAYMIAIIAIGVVALYEPIHLLIIYILIHILFVVLLPYFQKSFSILWGDIVNSSTMIIVAWIIQLLLYKNKIDEFLNKKIIEEKNNELNQLYIELINANKELEVLAKKDGLTGLYNRLMFDRLFDIKWNQCLRNSRLLTLIMIDIDFFKAYNDFYGHQAGDECIKKIAMTLSDFSINASSFVARYGGEEFVMVMSDIKREAVYLLAENIRKSIEDLGILHEISSVSHVVTISLGVSTIMPSNEYTMDQLLRDTDIALYEAKKIRNKVIFSELEEV
ncbi:MAG: GGDEF domain-containing protein [Lachnotalea sp.]